jgi:predicted HicB family RNase H-like nuclease
MQEMDATPTKRGRGRPSDHHPSAQLTWTRLEPSLKAALHESARCAGISLSAEIERRVASTFAAAA